MITVNTVANLATARPGDGDLVQTRGYSIIGIGENEYRYDRTSAAVIDDVFVINGPGGRGRYIATDQEELDATQAGVLFDGLADDTVALQRAVTVGVARGVAILLSPGTAIITATITVPPNTAKLHIVGSGRGSTTIDATALTNIPAIDISDSAWTHLSNFTLQGDASSGHGIQGIDPHWLALAYLPQHLQIDNLFITGFTGEQNMPGTSFGLPSPAGDKLIPACGIFLAGALEAHITDCSFLSNDIGMYLYACGQPKVQRCVFDSNASAGIVDQNNEASIYDRNDVITSSTVVGATFNLMMNSPRRGALTVDAAGLVTLGSHGCVISKSKFKGSRVNIVTESDYAPVITENWIRSDVKTGVLNYGPARIEQNTFFPAFIAPKIFTTNFAVNDKLISNGHGFTDGEEVILYSTGTLPAGLFVNTPLFVKTVTPNDFEVSVTPGGPSLDITSNGVGIHQAAVARREVWYSMPGATTCNIGSVSRNVFTYGGGGATHAHIQASSPAPINPIDGLIEGNYFGQPYAVANTTRVNFNVVTVGTVRALTVRDNVHHVPDGVTLAIRYIMPDNAVSPGPQFGNNISQLDGTGTIQGGDFFPANGIYRITATGRVLDVTYFGADATGTDDSQSAIVTAINNLQPGDELHFPAGTFLTGGNLVTPAGVKITGPGELKATGATTILLNLGNDTTVEELGINGDGIAGYGIFISDGVTGCHIRECRIGNLAAAVAVAIGVEGDGADNTVIEGNHLYDVIGTFSGRGVSLIGATTPATPIRGVKILGNTIDNIQGAAGGGDGIAVESWTATLDVLIDGNSVTNFTNMGIKLQSPGCNVTNNHIVLPFTAVGAIHAITSYTNVRGNTVEGASGAMIAFGPSLNTAGNNCLGNTILIPAAHGVASVDAIVTTGPAVSNVKISDNTIRVGSAIRSFVSLQGTGTGVLISGNTFDGPVDAASAAIFTGFDAPAAHTNDVIISHNVFSNVTGENLLDDMGQSSTGIQWIDNLSDGAEAGLTASTTIDLLLKGTFAGNPENALRGRIGSFITRSDGGSGTTGYLKEANADTTGWVPVAAGGGGGNAFGTVAVQGVGSAVADSVGDTLTLVGGTDITMAVDAGTDTITINYTGAGGVADGDKGDITVSGSGATWTIDNGVVTYAKLQDISATSRILGRITAGAGDAEELTAANVLTIIGVEAGADVTDATNVEAAGAVMVADTSTAGYGFVIDEDTMVSNSDTKVPTQQSVKAYVDANAGGIADGDKGDITVSGSGATWTIDSGVVTYAKIQNLTGPDLILGRATAGAGSAEELTATQVRTILNVEDGADVTDSTNVEAAGAVMVADTTTAGYGFVIDEDNMASNLDTKVPTQQSVKAYVDTAVGGAASAFGTIAVGATNIVADQANDTLTLTAGANITLTPTAGTDTIEIAASASGVGTFSTLPVDDATPDVSGIYLATTANTVATSITALDNGLEGQILEIHVNDANTSFVNNSNLALMGGANIPASTSPYRVIFRRDATQWQQISPVASAEHQFATSTDASDNLTLENTTTDADIVIKANGTGVVNVVADDLQLNGSPISGGTTDSFKTITVSGQSDVVADSATDTLTLAGTGGIAITTDAGTDTITIDGSGIGGGGNSFGTVAVSGQTDVVADQANDTLTLAGTGGIAITTTPGSDTVTIDGSAIGGGGLPAGGTVGDLVVNTGSGTGAWSSVLSVGANGATITGGTVTNPATPLAITQTWNDAADTFIGVDISIDADARASASRIFRIRGSNTGTSERFYVDDNGYCYSLTTFQAGGGQGASNPGFQLEDANNGFYLSGSQIHTKVSGSAILSVGATTSSFNSNVLYRRLVEANTAGSGAPNVLASTESHTVLTNEGSTAKNYHTLPTAVAGLTYTFVCQVADGIRVTANSGDTIRLGNKLTAAAGYVETTTIGDTITLVAINATEWVALSVLGTWTDGTFTFTLVSTT